MPSAPGSCRQFNMPYLKERIVLKHETSTYPKMKEGFAHPKRLKCFEKIILRKNEEDIHGIALRNKSDEYFSDHYGKTEKCMYYYYTASFTRGKTAHVSSQIY
jgi:hypothetical protein